mmetsp:Transcript_5776/g.14653  ORF Transcript_5776/g.14653 Transcript_5776/m.14653 type:complete len:89 (-) Transcript_5776:291-557(-)
MRLIFLARRVSPEEEAAHAQKCEEVRGMELARQAQLELWREALTTAAKGELELHPGTLEDTRFTEAIETSMTVDEVVVGWCILNEPLC